MRQPAVERGASGPVSTVLETCAVLLLILLGLGLLVAPPGQGGAPVCPAARVCAAHPDAVPRWTGFFMAWPSLAVLAGAVVPGRRLARDAARPGGLSAPQTVRRVRGLGWYLAVGALAAGLVESAARTLLLHRTAGWFDPAQWHVPLVTLLLGILLITLARVLRYGVAIRRALTTPT